MSGTGTLNPATPNPKREYLSAALSCLTDRCSAQMGRWMGRRQGWVNGKKEIGKEESEMGK